MFDDLYRLLDAFDSWGEAKRKADLRRDKLGKDAARLIGRASAEPVYRPVTTEDIKMLSDCGIVWTPREIP